MSTHLCVVRANTFKRTNILKSDQKVLLHVLQFSTKPLDNICQLTSDWSLPFE